MSLKGFRSLTRPWAPVLAGSLALAACGGGSGPTADTADAPASTEYVAERSRTDGVETVRTVSGSRWGGNPQLVEELAIGEEAGEAAYLFGAVSDAWATLDRIYAVDTQAPAVRAFDHQGNFLFDVGRTGQGPGEYSRPVGIAVTDDGRVLVTDLQGARVNVYDAEGNAVEDWALGSPQAALGLQLMDDGSIHTRMIELPEQISGMIAGDLREGMQEVGPDGPTGDPVFPPEIDYAPPTIEVDMRGNAMSMAILPFTPGYEWAFGPGGEMIAGVGNDYRFEIVAADGRKIVVEKVWEPVPVDPGERSFRAELAASQFRRVVPDFSIPESDVPETKPAFADLLPDRSGRLWVVRQGPSVPDPTCAEASGGSGMAIMIGSTGNADVVRGDSVIYPGGGEIESDRDCWANTHVFDVFEISSGELLGTVAAPELGFTRPLFVDGDTVLASVTDESGTVRLKKYRLVID